MVGPEISPQVVEEWNQTCETIWPYVTQMLGTRLDSAVLHVGCGNSQLGRLLHNAGFQHVVNVDYSEVGPTKPLLFSYVLLTHLYGSCS